MPLCGVKKSKHRDSSPPYGSRQIQELTDEKGRLEQEKGRLEQQLGQRERSLKSAETEIARLKDQVDNIQKEAASKPEAAVSDTVEEEKQKFEVQLHQVNLQIDQEKKQREEDTSKLKTEVEQTTKQLSEEKAQRQKLEEERERLKRDKEKVESDLRNTKKELEESTKSLQDKTKHVDPTSEWQAKIAAAQVEFERERSHRLDREKEITRLNSEKLQISDELARVKTCLTETENEVSRLKKEKSRLEDDNEGLKKSNELALSMNQSTDNTEKNFLNQINSLQETLSDYKLKLDEAESEKDQLLTRLSNATSTKMYDDNPTVTDLSDKNRPQKLAEYMTQLYDDEWTTCIEKLDEMNKNEEESVKILLDILIETYSHCKEVSDSQMAKIEEDMFLPPMDTAEPKSPLSDTEAKSPTTTKPTSKIPRFTPQKSSRIPLAMGQKDSPSTNHEHHNKESLKGKKSGPSTFPRMKGEKYPEIPQDLKRSVKEYRKRVAERVIPVIQKEMTQKLSSKPDLEPRVLEVCSEYMEKCVRVCWLMRIQDPPVHLSWHIPPDRGLDTELFKEYTKTGSYVHYVVWPTLFLHEGGPLLVKGVAQGADS